MKYKRFIDAIGGWARAAGHPRRRWPRSPASTGSRSPMSRPAGCWSSRRSPPSSSAPGSASASIAPTICALFAFALDDEDRARASTRRWPTTTRIPGDCGDEYRRPPYPHRLGRSQPPSGRACPRSIAAAPVPGRPRPRSASIAAASGSRSAATAARCAIGDRILVSGTTATHGSGEVVCPGDPAGQTVYILDKIAASLAALGGSARGRRAHPHLSARRRRSGSRWRASTAAISATSARPTRWSRCRSLVGDYEVEIEAEAVVG